MMDNIKSMSVLKKLYMQDPCKVLPNALWKTNDRLSKFECSYTYAGNEILDFKAWDQNWLHIFWNRSRKVDQSARQIVERSKSMIIHDDYFRQIRTEGYSLVKSYFRIIHDHQAISPYSLASDFCINNSRPDQESSDISVFIGKCYKELHPSVDAVRSWTTHSVFDEDLWIWIIDKRKDCAAALGIAEFDETVGEGSLEWIQVLPEYQGRGLGRVLVLELLTRLARKAKFSTVSGEVDNATNPEKLYRACGFTGDDVWWLLHK